MAANPAKILEASRQASRLTVSPVIDVKTQRGVSINVGIDYGAKKPKSKKMSHQTYGEALGIKAPREVVGAAVKGDLLFQRTFPKETNGEVTYVTGTSTRNRPNMRTIPVVSDLNEAVVGAPVRFVGVTATLGRADGKPRQFNADASGLMGVINTGPRQIVAGTKVYLNANPLHKDNNPYLDQRGYAPQKLRPQICGLDAIHKKSYFEISKNGYGFVKGKDLAANAVPFIQEQVDDFLQTTENALRELPDDVKPLYTQDMYKMFWLGMKMMNHAHEACIGKAQSNASCGDTMEVQFF